MESLVRILLRIRVLDQRNSPTLGSVFFLAERKIKMATGERMDGVWDQGRWWKEGDKPQLPGFPGGSQVHGLTAASLLPYFNNFLPFL